MRRKCRLSVNSREIHDFVIVLRRATFNIRQQDIRGRVIHDLPLDILLEVVRVDARREDAQLAAIV